MKKIIVILLALIFASCSNSFQLTKRHYMKGYYVSNQKHLKEKSVASSHSRQEKPAVPPTILETPSNLSNLSEPTLEPSSSGRPQEKVRTSKSEKALPVPLKEKKSATSSLSKLKTNPFLVKRVEHISPAYNGEGRSLFWIVVLVLLILWALGIISGSFGIGILFNLLLLIALILLILWLLRIV